MNFYWNGGGGGFALLRGKSDVHVRNYIPFSSVSIEMSDYVYCVSI